VIYTVLRLCYIWDFGYICGLMSGWEEIYESMCSMHFSLLEISKQAQSTREAP
jgi:hypothetical protein